MDDKMRYVVKDPFWGSVALSGIMVVVFFSVGIYWYFNQVVPSQISRMGILGNTSAETSAEESHPGLSVLGVNEAAAGQIDGTRTVQSNGLAKTILTFSGSNTIGAQLGPDLARGFLKELGATLVWERTGEVDNEVKVVGETKEGLLQIHVRAHGSSTGFSDLKAGTCDIAMASRKIKENEVRDLDFLGDMTGLASEHVLGLDGIAIIVNPNNPLMSLSVHDAADIFSGRVANWASLGAGAKKIHVNARNDMSGTFDTFRHLVLKDVELVGDALRFESNAVLSDTVSQTIEAIGFTSLPDIRDSKALAISDGSASILPTFYTVATEDYPLSRRLYLYNPSQPTNSYTLKFIRYALSAKGQETVNSNGFVDLTIKSFLPRLDPENVVIDHQVYQEYVKAIDGARRLSLNFRFRSGGTELDNRAYRDLDRMVDYFRLNKADYQKIYLIGFADNRGDYIFNRQLAMDRADVVANEFNARGLNSTIVISLGEELPVANNDTPAGREKNRRVEVWVK